jgi:isoleucyl-tRNA synthetase
MDYRETLNLPQTTFKMKANLTQREPLLLKRWEREGLYRQLQQAAADRPLFVLHDGPPYANGNIHLGTAFNKVLKDIILRAKRMAGCNAPYIPGWDCHGLPIEHNVDLELGEKKQTIPVLSKRAACRKYAEKWIKTQREQFKRLGVLGDWDNPYLTMNHAYEAVIAREFNRFLLSGAVVRAKKPVYWCATCGPPWPRPRWTTPITARRRSTSSFRWSTIWAGWRRNWPATRSRCSSGPPPPGPCPPTWRWPSTRT